MAVIASVSADRAGFSATLAGLIAAEGTAGHLFVHSVDLNSGKFATRNLADAVHYLSILHGRYPGVVDLAALHTAHNAARKWFLTAADGFAVERQYLTKLVVAAGPLPSTPGQAETESATNGQCHALDMLARSDRDGCALGAAMTLVLDWHAVRSVLDVAATRWGLAIPGCTIPSPQDTFELACQLATTPAIERAIGFGAQQILNQHRGLWDLLEARHIARGEY